MDDLLKALANPGRLRVVQILLHAGPLRQAAIAARLEALDGTMSKHVNPLLAAGVVSRDTDRGECRVAHPHETVAALKALAHLDRAIKDQRAADARETAERLDDIELGPSDV